MYNSYKLQNPNFYSFSEMNYNGEIKNQKLKEEEFNKVSLSVFASCDEGWILAVDSRTIDEDGSIISDNTQKYIWDDDKKLIVNSWGTNDYIINGNIVNWKEITKPIISGFAGDNGVALSKQIMKHFVDNRLYHINFGILDYNNDIFAILNEQGQISYKSLNIEKNIFTVQGFGILSVSPYLYLKDKIHQPGSLEDLRLLISDYFQENKKVFMDFKNRFTLSYDCPFGGTISYFMINKNKNVELVKEKI